MTIEWNEKLAIGNADIDADHQHLIKLINAYERAVASENLKLLGPAFQSLEDYAIEHFEREERLMNAVHYPNRRPHRMAHQELLKLVRKKHEEISSGAKVDIDKLSKFLRDWLIDHVVREDMQLKPYVMGGRDS